MEQNGTEIIEVIGVSTSSTPDYVLQNYNIWDTKDKQLITD